VYEMGETESDEGKQKLDLYIYRTASRAAALFLQAP
jgi:hypothetical protein